MENQITITEDSMVFSALYENYEMNIKNDNYRKKLGIWAIEESYRKTLKYAYVYLTDCDGMIVKKYKIIRFEKDTNSPDKYYFCFENGEDFFVQYPFGIVQGHHYVESSKIESLPRLEQSEINKRIDKSRNTKMSKPRIKKIIMLNPREQLSKVFLNKYFMKKQKIRLSDLSMLDKQVEEGQDPDMVLTNYFNNLESKKKIS
jgi:hypothetical protein